MVPCPTGQMFLRLDVVYCAQWFDSGLWHNSSHNFTFHGDKRVPVFGNLLIRSQLKLTGERMGVVHCCRGQKDNNIWESYTNVKITLSGFKANQSNKYVQFQPQQYITGISDKLIIDRYTLYSSEFNKAVTVQTRSTAVMQYHLNIWAFSSHFQVILKLHR